MWASKFNERAFLATKKLGITLSDIFMGVLVQKIVPAEYAFVVHTVNPTNGNDHEVYVEAVRGLGEALVAAFAGTSFSFVYDKKTGATRVLSYANKVTALHGSGFIFRSDSNSEDLKGFAGAGIFDSFPMVENEEEQIIYHQDRLTTDEVFRKEFM